MLSDFSAAAKRAQARIVVPDAPLERIRTSVSSRRQRGKVRALVCSAAITLACAGTAAAFGLYNGVHIWFAGNKTAVAVRSLALVREPQERDLRDVVSRATFPVVLPVGLPAGTHVWKMTYAPAEHPTMVELSYINAATGFRTGVTLFDSSAVNGGSVPATAMWRPSADVYKWQAGRETVVVVKSALSAANQRRMETAMASASPESSLRATIPMLSTATILNIAPDAGEVAARYMPKNGRTVVLGRRFPETIARILKHRRALRDTRTTYLTNIPSKDGAPDYAHATLQWPNTGTVIPADGIRAIDAVYRIAGIRGDCGCMTFFNELPGSQTYRIWILRGTPPNVTLRKYRIDEKSLRVIRE